MTLFGANWKTTVSGIGAALFSLLTILAALPYELGDLATIIPPYWKGKVTAVSLIAALGLRVWNSVAQKSKEVTGGTVQQDTSGGTIPENQRPSLVEATKNATAKAETAAAVANDVLRRAP